MKKGKQSPIGPPKPEVSLTSFRLSSELLEQVRRAAKKHGHTITAVVEWCLRESLPRLK